MTPTSTRTFRLGEFHEFYARRHTLPYIVPAGAIFELDRAAATVLDQLAASELSLEELVDALGALGLTAEDASACSAN